MAQDPANAARIKRNVAKIRSMGGSEDDVQGYLASEQEEELPVATPAFSGGAVADATRARTPEREETSPDPYGPARTMVNAFTMGLSPTIRGATKGVGAMLKGEPFGPAYREEKDAEVQGIRNYRQRHPGAAAGLSLAAGLPPAIATGLKLGPLSTPSTAARPVMRGIQNMGKGAATGAIFGAAAGSGVEGDLPAQLKGALKGGVIGAGAGAAVPPILAGARKGGRAIARGLGIPGQQQLQEGTDEALETFLLRTGQSSDDVTRRAERFRGAGVKPVRTVEAMGPAGAPAVKGLGPLEQGDEWFPSHPGLPGQSASGRAFEAGGDIIESAKDRVATPGVAELYDEARAVGDVVLPKRGQRAIQYLKAKFPKITDEIAQHIDDEAINDPAIWGRMVDPQTGDFTIEYYDLLKKRVDAEVYGRTEAAMAKDAQAVSWVKNNRDGVKKALNELVESIDEAVQTKSGEPVYRDARRTAQAGIEAQKELGDVREAVGPALQKAALKPTRAGTGTDPVYGGASGLSGRAWIAMREALETPLGAGLRRTTRKQAGNTLESLLREDPEELFREIAKRQVFARQAAAGRRQGGAAAGGAFFGPKGRDR